MKISQSRMIKMGAVILVLFTVGILAVIFTNCDYRSLGKLVLSANPIYIAAAAACMCCFICCESVNIGRIVKSFGYRCSFVQSLKYGACGFFFSGITPSSSGGQPMQLYYMSRDSIKVSHASLALLVELMGFQAATMIISSFGIIYNFSYLLTLPVVVNIFIIIGMLINSVIFLLLMFLIFVPKASYSLEEGLKKCCLRIKKDKWIKSISDQMDEYRRGAVYIRRNKKLLFKNMITVLIQLMAIYSITYFVYLAVGGIENSWTQIFSLQSVLNAGIAMIPVPGTAGVGEGGFQLMFASIFNGKILLPGLMLSRGISFYFGMIVSGSVLAAAVIKNLCVHRKISAQSAGGDII